jgi:hypothetical protein
MCIFQLLTEPVLHFIIHPVIFNEKNQKGIVTIQAIIVLVQTIPAMVQCTDYSPKNSQCHNTKKNFATPSGKIAL